MKLLVFAHTPPPHHGQSYMIKLMLDGFGGDVRRRPAGSPANPYGIECYHINARFSRQLGDVGTFRGGKLILAVGYCLQALWCRFRYGVNNFYYVPAPGKATALYRDWLVMFLCRPFFKRVILHWHAAGLAEWLETEGRKTLRAITYRLFQPVNLSVILSQNMVADGEKFLSQRMCMVQCGIPDPCPQFAELLRPRRLARHALRCQWLAGQTPPNSELGLAGSDVQVIKVLYLAHCMREKGLFDTLDAVALANQEMAQKNFPVRLHLTVAGEFVTPDEQLEFHERVARPDLQTGVGAAARSCVTYLGFVSGEKKWSAFSESDCFCFPTYYHAESFGLVAVGAMAFGLPIVTTHWRSLPEMFPPGYPGLVAPRSPRAVATALLQLLAAESGERLREHYLAHFTVERYLSGLAKAIRNLEAPAAPGGMELPGRP